MSSINRGVVVQQQYKRNTTPEFRFMEWVRELLTEHKAEICPTMILKNAHAYLAEMAAGTDEHASRARVLLPILERHIPPKDKHHLTEHLNTVQLYDAIRLDHMAWLDSSTIERLGSPFIAFRHPKYYPQIIELMKRHMERACVKGPVTELCGMLAIEASEFGYILPPKMLDLLYDEDSDKVVTGIELEEGPKFMPWPGLQDYGKCMQQAIERIRESRSRNGMEVAQAMHDAAHEHNTGAQLKFGF